MRSAVEIGEALCEQTGDGGQRRTNDYVCTYVRLINAHFSLSPLRHIGYFCQKPVFSVAVTRTARPPFGKQIGTVIAVPACKNSAHSSADWSSSTDPCLG